MDVYLYASADTPANAAAQNFMDITELYRLGFLTSTSTVWMNADAPEAGMWVLTDRSTYVKVYRTVYAGWLRFTRTTARWGRTIHTSVKEGSQVLDIRDIPGESDTSATIVVLHRDANAKLSVVADGSVQRADSSGVFRFDPFTAIDLHHYKAPENPKPVSGFTAAHAMLNGAAVMGCTSADGGAFVKENMDIFRIDVTDEQLAWVGKTMGDIEQYARIITTHLTDRIAEMGKEGKWSQPQPVTTG
ncbi:MAG: hypothetical protein E6R04_04505 [Spirochaetes bacterium]|nr:MAG: hypothetical protein E6R04_04505 [Spirochaetota bacterium]